MVAPIARREDIEDLAGMLVGAGVTLVWDDNGRLGVIVEPEHDEEQGELAMNLVRELLSSLVPGMRHRILDEIIVHIEALRDAEGLDDD